MQPENLEETPEVFPLVKEEREPFWGYLDLLLMIGLLFASLIVIGLAANGWLHFHPQLKGDLTALALPLQAVAYLLVYLSFWGVFKLKYNRAVFESLGWQKTGHSLAAAGAGGVLLYFGIAAVAALVHTPKVETPFDELVKTPFSMALLAVTAVFLAPLFEEMIFRGFLQPLLSRTLGAALGVLVTALLFGGLHASEYSGAWQYVAAITVVGIALGVLRAKTNSIIPGTVMHGCFNAVSVVGLLAMKYLPHK
jgi:membrane protease YdiL (CAAX protease family)